MLGKLIKHEFKATARVIPVIYLAVLLLFLVGLSAKTMKIQTVLATSAFLLMIAVFATIVVTYGVVIVRYYRSMFGNEGYLTGALPVTSGQLLFSKALVALLWIGCSLLLSILAIFGFVYVVIPDDVTFAQIKQLVLPLWEQYKALVVFMFVSMLAQLVLFIAELYFAIALSNTRSFIKYNIAFSVVWMFVTMLAVNLLETLFLLLIPVSIDLTTGDIAFKSMLQDLMGSIASAGNADHLGIGSLLVDILASVVLFPVTNWMIKRKVSVK